MRQEYSGIPGTMVFDGEQSRRGYHLNQFCMSLLRPANRDRFKADEEAYLSEWNLTEMQRSAVLRRDYNAMIAEGGNIYFLRKIGATDGKSFVQLAASMTGMTPRSYTAMMATLVRWLQGHQGMDIEQHARHRHPCIQPSCDRLQPRSDTDLRTGMRGGVQTCG